MNKSSRFFAATALSALLWAGAPAEAAEDSKHCASKVAAELVDMGMALPSLDSHGLPIGESPYDHPGASVSKQGMHGVSFHTFTMNLDDPNRSRTVTHNTVSADYQIIVMANDSPSSSNKINKLGFTLIKLNQDCSYKEVDRQPQIGENIVKLPPTTASSCGYESAPTIQNPAIAESLQLCCTYFPGSVNSSAAKWCTRKTAGDAYRAATILPAALTPTGPSVPEAAAGR